MGEVVHCCLDIRGALKSKRWHRSFTHEDGRRCTPEEAKAFLREQLALGRRVLPVGDECEGFDYQTGCPGHAKPELCGDPFAFASPSSPAKGEA